MRGLAHKRHEVDVLWAEGRADHFDGELGGELLAREDVDIGVAGAIAEMPGDGGGLDQLHQRISGCLRHMLGEMLEQRRPVGLHADGLDESLDEAGNVRSALHAVYFTRCHIDDEMLAPHGGRSSPG
jgi:hypothetical protein